MTPKLFVFNLRLDNSYFTKFVILNRKRYELCTILEWNNLKSYTWKSYVVPTGGGLSQKLLEGTVKVVEPAKCVEKYAGLSKDETVEAKYSKVTIDSEVICAGDTDQSACEVCIKSL